jgi:hypothetical protein
MRELLYLSKKKLGTFLPDWPSLSVRGTGGVGVGPVSVTVDVSAASTAGFDEATIKAFRRVRGHLERDASYFTSPDLETGSGSSLTSTWDTARYTVILVYCPRRMT